MPSESSEREMVQSMLQMTTEDDWNDLSARSRLYLAKRKLNGSDDLSDEQERWLIDEQNRAMVDLKEAMIDDVTDIEKNVLSYLKDVSDAIHPSAELSEDMEDNASNESEKIIEQIHKIERRHRNKWRDTLEEGDELGSAYHRGYVDGLERGKEVIRDD